MNLREQIKTIAARRVNPVFAKYMNERVPAILHHLAYVAFVDEWNDEDACVVRYACKLLARTQMITEEEPAAVALHDRTGWKIGPTRLMGSE